MRKYINPYTGLLILLISRFFCVGCRNDDNIFYEKEQLTVRNLMKAYREAWIRGDSAKVGKILSDSISLYMPGEKGKTKTGKKAVLDFWFPPGDVNYPIDRYIVTNEKVEISGIFCVYTGVSIMTWHQLSKGVHSDTSSATTEFLNIMLKENDVWHLYKVMYNLKGKDYLNQ